MSREGYYLPEVGIVYENGDIITKGPVLEIVQQVEALLDKGDYNAIMKLVNGESIQNLSNEEWWTFVEVVLPGFIGFDISQVSLEAEPGYCTMFTEGVRYWDEDYERDLPDWVKQFREAAENK